MEFTRLLTYIIVALTVLFLVAIIATVAIAATIPPEPFFGFHHTAGGFLVMVIWMVFFWALVIGGVVLFVAWLSGQFRPARIEVAEDPLEILRRRFARGEISREEYERMQRDLER